jgi:GMP synthase (glutamine-hydrolysing)
MTEPRLKTEIWVKACVRRASVEGIALAVVKRGDPDGGAVLVKLNRHADGCMVLTETRDGAGARAWLKGTGAVPVTEADADAYITRNRKIDPDLWVIEIEDRLGRLPFDARIL